MTNTVNDEFTVASSFVMPIEIKFGTIITPPPIPRKLPTELANNAIIKYI